MNLLLLVLIPLLLLGGGGGFYYGGPWWVTESQEAEVIFTVNAGAAGENGTFSGGATAYSFTHSIGRSTPFPGPQRDRVSSRFVLVWQQTANELT
jgi:hypothetical protein